MPGGDPRGGKGGSPGAGITPGRFSTETVLGTTAADLSSGQSATITATVSSVADLGLGGWLGFIDVTNHTFLGSSLLGWRDDQRSACLMHMDPCQGSVTVSASELAIGLNEIVGFYSGDWFNLPSSGSIDITLDGPVTTITTPVYPTSLPTCPSGVTTCTTACPPAEGTCSTGLITSPDGSTTVDIESAEPASGVETITTSFGGLGLPCQDAGTGDVLNFSSVNSGGPKYLEYTVSGADATTAYDDHPNGYICFESPDAFSTSAGQPATLDPSTDQYYGALPYCGDNSEGDVYPAPGSSDNANPPPCIEWEQYSTAGGTPTWTTWIEATQADPHLVG